MQFRKTWLIIPIVLMVFLSGCSVVENGSVGHQDNAIPLVDGFDFPVGDRNGNGWGITGYRFLDWSNASNSWHPGEDWNIPGAGNGDQGQPVYSIGHGLVVAARYNTALGNVVLVKHRLPDNSFVWSQYAHLDRMDVQVGDVVERRQQVGTVGRGPNNRFAAHLHFEIRNVDIAYNAWPRTNGVPWEKSRVTNYWVNPSQFINQYRP